MQDLTLNFEDKTINNDFLTGKRLVLQSVVLALQCWSGDWFLNSDYGTPYELRMENKSLLLADIRDVILGVDGVTDVQDLDITVRKKDNSKTQLVFEVNANIFTDKEEFVEYNGLLEVIGR